MSGVQKPLAAYKRPAFISEDESLEGCNVYCLDGHPDKRGGDYDMAQDVGLPSCHCCDSFIVEKDAVSFIEITEISEDNNSIKWGLDGYIDSALKEEFFRKKFLPMECMLKVYGSMAVLSRFALKCPDEQGGRLVGKYKFWLVIHGTGIKDAKGLALVSQDITAALRNKLGSVLSGFLAEKVEVLLPGDLREKIKKAAVFS